MKKPSSIASDQFMSEKWDELTEGRSFNDSDAPVIALLCSWYAVVDRCLDDITTASGVNVAYENSIGGIKALPQLATMKQASAEIRALNKQLGINDTAQNTEKEETPLARILRLHTA